MGKGDRQTVHNNREKDRETIDRASEQHINR